MAPQVSPVQHSKASRVAAKDIRSREQLLDHFKDRGHFDDLRRLVMAEFNASVRTKPLFHD